MSRLHSTEDECAILVKAIPHRSTKYFETVCCAGIGRDIKWRRLYPVPFRFLTSEKKFGRWDWIKYRFTTSQIDIREETQRVDDRTIEVVGKMRMGERSRVLGPVIRRSTHEAERRGESLALVRPERLEFVWKKKPSGEYQSERAKHRDAASQTSLLEAHTKPFEPCPYAFRFRWRDSDGQEHEHACDDWETVAAFSRRREIHGENAGLLSLKKTYEDDYFRRGLAFALGTHSRRQQWLLVGLIRLDDDKQGQLFI